MRAFVIRVYAALLLILGPVVFVSTLGPWIDKLQGPVVYPFVVTQTLVWNDSVVLRGWMQKRAGLLDSKNGCEPKEVYALTYESDDKPHVAGITFSESPTGKLINRPAGTQYWGPWTIAITADTTKVVVHTRHQCQPLWDTMSEFTVFERSEHAS